MVPQPVTTPSPGTLVFSMPKSVQRCSTYMSNSSKEPSSSSRLEALARGQLAALVLRLDAGRAAAGARLFAAHFKLFKDFFHGHPMSRGLTVHSMGAIPRKWATCGGVAHGA